MFKNSNIVISFVDLTFDIWILIILVYLINPKPVLAIINPQDYKNNKFGIHLAVPDDKDLAEAAKLVNSSGGDWGYVTLVIQENDRDKGKWQGVFDKMRKLHLIPIVRLATSPQGEVWRRPAKEDAGEWLSFLNSLNWVVKNRYVILFNEPNHASEWGGEVNPENYAEVAAHFAKALKKSNPDYFLMLAGLDQAAPTIGKQMLSEEQFISRLFNNSAICTRSELGQLPQFCSGKQFNNLFDGLCSHSYPNPGFSASPNNSGRQSIRGYEWELELLRNYGVDKKLPVFITETGWSRANLAEETVAEYYQKAFNNVWLSDEQVIAVTPFILNYQTQPFLDFSFRKKESEDYYSNFQVLQKIEKNKGEPEQITLFSFLYILPNELVANSNYTFKIRLKNIGQSIWQPALYALAVSDNKDIDFSFSPIKTTEPNYETESLVKIKTKAKKEAIGAKIYLTKNKAPVSNSYRYRFWVNANLNLTVNFKILFGKDQGDNFKIELFDQDEKIVHQQRNLSGKKGIINVKNIKNVVIRQKYRLVVLKPGCLPRQTYVTIANPETKANLKIFLPFDFNRDGKFSFSDLFLGFLAENKTQIIMHRVVRKAYFKTGGF